MRSFWAHKVLGAKPKFVNYVHNAEVRPRETNAKGEMHTAVSLKDVPIAAYVF